MYWLVRRKDFDVNKWRVPCKYLILYAGANITVRSIAVHIPSAVKSVLVATSKETLLVWLAMGLGKTIRFFMKDRKTEWLRKRRLERNTCLCPHILIFKRRCSTNKNINWSRGDLCPATKSKNRSKHYKRDWTQKDQRWHNRPSLNHRLVLSLSRNIQISWKRDDCFLCNW